MDFVPFVPGRYFTNRTQNANQSRPRVKFSTRIRARGNDGKKVASNNYEDIRTDYECHHDDPILVVARCHYHYFYLFPRCHVAQRKCSARRLFPCPPLFAVAARHGVRNIQGCRAAFAIDTAN